jgi:predicted protein tyrosine phosphatase
MKEEFPANTLQNNRIVLLEIPTIIFKNMKMNLILLLKKMKQNELMKKVNLKQPNAKSW